jgi:glycosyltransferase involved in cell wall biosynthesis
MSQDEKSGTIVLPAYNESAMVADSLRRIVPVLATALDDRRWEVLVVDDGSADDTAAIAVAAAAEVSTDRVRVRVLRHIANRGLGGALQTGFAQSTGDVVVVVDCDLSYHPDHILALVRAVEDGSAQIAVASPYMPGGRTVGVPPALERRSRWANRFLATLSGSDLHTYTGMVRAYDGPYVRALALKAADDMINVETLYKTSLLHGRVVEVPAVLDWTGLAARAGRTRMRDRRIRAKTYELIARGIMYRPYLVFATGGTLLFLVGGAIGLASMLLPGTQVGLTVLGVSMMVAGFSAGLISVISMQVKRGFEELFYQHSPARTLVRTVHEDRMPADPFVVSLTPGAPPRMAAGREPDPVGPMGIEPVIIEPVEPLQSVRKSW